jgi:hypothetical protein
MKEIELKSKELDMFVNYAFKEEDVDYIVKEKKRFAKDTDKIAERKIGLLRQKDLAIECNDFDKVRELDEQIQDLDTKAFDINAKRSGNFNLLA